MTGLEEPQSVKVWGPKERRGAEAEAGTELLGELPGLQSEGKV